MVLPEDSERVSCSEHYACYVVRYHLLMPSMNCITKLVT